MSCVSSVVSTSTPDPSSVQAKESMHAVGADAPCALAASFSFTYQVLPRKGRSGTTPLPRRWTGYPNRENYFVNTTLAPTSASKQASVELRNSEPFEFGCG